MVFERAPTAMGAAIADEAQAASLLRSGENCYAVARAGRAAFLVDAESYFHALRQAAERATRSIIIIGWDFDSRTALAPEQDERRGAAPAQLGDFLNDLVKRRRSLHVYVLNWDYPMVFADGREMRPLYGLGWTPRRRVHLHYDNTHPPGGSHHQKIVVIDDAVAFSGGLDLGRRRWDTCAHQAHDARRIADGEPYPPFHDTMALVDGDAARALGEVARHRWTLATGEIIPPAAERADPWPPAVQPDVTDVDLGISRTVPKIDSLPQAREIEALCLAMIAAAKRYIYIENPYLTSDRIGAALAARLAEPDPPEVVLVTRCTNHGWLDEHTVQALRTRFVKRLQAADSHGGFQVYYPFVPQLDAGTCVDCQSNVMIVDDEWLRIGSANLSNRSMALDTECDLTFEARGKRRICEAVRCFRDRLLAEHLDVPLERVRERVSASGSLHEAIRALQGDGRTLKVLELADSSDTPMDLASVGDPEPPVPLERLIHEFAPDTSEHKSGPAWGKIAGIAFAVVCLTALWRYTPLSGIFTPERVIDWADSVGEVPWAPLVVMAAYTPACFVMFPRPLITLFAVIAFGPALGLAYSLLGIVGAALSTYFVGRMLPRDTVRKLAGEKLNEMTEVLRRRGLLAIFAVRIVPVAPFAIEGMVAGAVGIKLWHYTLGTVLGMLPGTLTTTVFGEQIKTALQDPSQINYWLVAGVVLFFGGVILTVRRWFLKEQRAHRHAPATATA